MLLTPGCSLQPGHAQGLHSTAGIVLATAQAPEGAGYLTPPPATPATRRLSSLSGHEEQFQVCLLGW